MPILQFALKGHTLITLARLAFDQLSNLVSMFTK